MCKIRFRSSFNIAFKITCLKEYSVNFLMIFRLIHLWFSNYRFLKFAELFESQKWSFSIFSVLKVLNKIKKIENDLKPPKLVRRSLFKQFQQKLDIFRFFTKNLAVLVSVTLCVGHNTDLRSNGNISKTVRSNIASTRMCFAKVFKKAF